MAINYLEQARGARREVFVGATPHFFLLGAPQLDRPTRPDATVPIDLVDTDEETHVLGWGEPRVERRSSTALALPVRKVQPMYPAMITIGRTLNNDIVIQDTSVSKFHAYFRVPPGGIAANVSGIDICDAGSRNGTWVDERQAPPKLPLRVHLGAVLRFGNVKLALVDAEEVWEHANGRPLAS